MRAARVLTLTTSPRPVTNRHRLMSASVTVLADHRAARAEVRVTVDPLVFARSWWDFLAGVR